MDFIFDFSIYPTNLMPFGLDGWLFHAVPTALIIWRERSALHLARRDYAVALFLRLLGIGVLGVALIVTSSYLVFTHDPATDSSLLIENQPWPLIVIASFIHILAGLVLTPVLVRRIRDAGIAQRWSYLAVLPYLDAVMYLGLLFYPPTRSAAPAEAAA